MSRCLGALWLLAFVFAASQWLFGAPLWELFRGGAPKFAASGDIEEILREMANVLADGARRLSEFSPAAFGELAGHLPRFMMRVPSTSLAAWLGATLRQDAGLCFWIVGVWGLLLLSDCRARAGIRRRFAFSWLGLGGIPVNLAVWIAGAMGPGGLSIEYLVACMFAAETVVVAAVLLLLLLADALRDSFPAPGEGGEALGLRWYWRTIRQGLAVLALYAAISALFTCSML